MAGTDLKNVIILKNVRLAFSDIFEPRAFEEGQTKKYGAALLVPKDSKQVAEINKLIKHVAVEKWGAKAEAVLKPLVTNPNKFCFQDGDTKSQYDGFEGHMALSTKSDKRPLVLDRDKSPLEAADGKPYSGCYVYASVQIWAQDNKWGKGIRATLRWVQFYKDGDAFAGGAPASEEEVEDLSVTEEEGLA